MEKERFFGTIFFPDAPEEKFSGVWLIIKDTSIILETSFNSYSTRKWDIILGEFTGIGKITFVNCYPGASSLGDGGHHLDIEVSYVIKDFHAFSIEDLAFEKIVLISPALTKWIIEKEGITYSSDFRTFQIPETEEIAKVKIDDNFSIIINLYYSKSISRRELHITKECNISIESNSLLDIKEFDKKMRHLKKLILFLTNKNPEFKKYNLSKDDNNGYELLNTNADLKEDRFTQGIHITYWNVKDSLSGMIQKWFELKKLTPVIDLVLEKCFNTEMSVDGFFMSVYPALEIFQNNFAEKSEEILNPLIIENRDKIAKIIEDEKLRNWFNGFSERWNNPKQKEHKFMEFESDFKELTEGVFGFTTKEFILKIVNARNGIVHRGNYKDYFTSWELFLAAKILEFTLKLRILKLIGVDTRLGHGSLFHGANGALKVLVSINK